MRSRGFVSHLTERLCARLVRESHGPWGAEARKAAIFGKDLGHPVLAADGDELRV